MKLWFRNCFKTFPLFLVSKFFHQRAVIDIYLHEVNGNFKDEFTSLNLSLKMGKDKEQKTEASGNAFSRMNYLYQAAELVTKTCDSKFSPLSNYYNKIMKEISKKVVEKLHPDLKRTICCACNHPLTSESNQINVKVKSHRKRRKKKDLSTPKQIKKLPSQNTNVVDKYSRTRVEVRNKRPNKLCWFCQRCGFTKQYLQKPSYKIWIHKVKDSI